MSRRRIRLVVAALALAAAGAVGLVHPADLGWDKQKTTATADLGWDVVSSR